MRRQEIRKKYEIVISKIMERYNFLVNENEKYHLMNQKIENEDIRRMLYQMRESIRQIYNDQILIENIEFCLGLKSKDKKKEGCVIQ